MFAALLRGDAAIAGAAGTGGAGRGERRPAAGGRRRRRSAGRLADRLLALDLPKRAGPVLEKLMQAAPTGVARAGFGARLAALRLREGDAAGALAALELRRWRPARRAGRTAHAAACGRRNARRGDTERALAALGTLDTAAADEARATILERANDWPAAQRALAAYVARIVPAQGKLDDAQRRTLLRLATAAARAGDEAALAALRSARAPRMGAGPLADMFRLLTADPVRGVARSEAVRPGGGAGARPARPAEGIAAARRGRPQ